LAAFQDGKLKTFFLFLNSILLLFTLTVIVIVLIVVVMFCFVFVFVYQVEQDFGVVGRDGQGPPETLDGLLGVAFHPPEVSDLKENDKFLF
jgi:hypothetical protein